MKPETKEIFLRYQQRHDSIRSIGASILTVYDVLNRCFEKGGKLLVCGNGGSAADADHIVGELVKAFHKKRPLTGQQKEALTFFGAEGLYLAEALQGSLPAISLCAHTSLLTAILNDVGADAVYAQQVLGYGGREDVLIGISTSGNSKNVLYAGIAAKALGMETVALTGESGGRMAELFNYSLRAPTSVTPDVQDIHSVIYHLLCLMLEAERWAI